MKTLHFVDQALVDLEDILSYTIQNFGTDQAEIYRARLLDRCYMIATGGSPGRDCSILLGQSSRSILKYVLAEKHYVMFMEDEDTVIIAGFLHQSSDLQMQIEKLSRRV